MERKIVYINHPGIMNEGEVLSYENAPMITKEDYEARIQSALTAADAYTHLLVYADKEHFSNLEYLTGYDPRYEECILLLAKGKIPWMLLGNEGMGQAQCVTISHEKILFQSLSPSGQARGNSKPLKDIFQEYGINKHANVGVVGWKLFTEAETDDPGHMFEIPYFIIRALEDCSCGMENATALFMDSEYGLRSTFDVKTLILSEIASTKASRKTWNFMNNIKPGMSEIEASQAFEIDGEPCPTYPNICFYGKGILSPDYHRKLEINKPIAFGMGYRYAQIHRVGMYTNQYEDLSAEIQELLPKLFEQYYKAVAIWYESLGIGQKAGEVWEAVRALIGSYEEFGIALNPGHLIGTEEWLNSPFSENNSTSLKSGMLLQCDFTARPSWCKGLGVHLEDGVILADEKTQAELEKMAPDSYRRMRQRQAFMREILGIRIRDEVLPTSDLCGIFHPFLANLNCIMAIQS